MAPRVALSLLRSAIAFGLVGCTVGAPAAGTSAPDPTSEPSGPGTADGDEPATPPAATEPEGVKEKARWTFFVYANGDNGRSRELAADLEHMNEAMLQADVEVIVFADWNAALTDREGRPFPSGSEWISLAGHGAKPRVRSASESEQDLEDPAVLRSAVARAFGQHPADHRGVIVWSRGEGGDAQDGTRPGAAAMSTPAMIAAIRDGLADIGLTGERTLDVLGFDSYAPARIEIAYATRELAGVYVANPAGSNGTTWAYADALGFLANTSDATGATFAAFEAEAARKIGGPPHVAVHTEKLERLADATSSLVRAIAAHPEVMPRVVSAMMAAAEAPFGSGPPSYQRFVSELANDPSLDVVTATAQEVAIHLSEALVYAPGGAELGITLPLTEASPAWLAEYAETAREWLAATGWDALLASYASSEP
ncbi:MAG: hypothetical protein J0I07_05085 [Myxococcales bacterium]|nr:hypothetical protein [Myxococcales bacterium]